MGLGCTVTTLCDIVFMADTAWMADTHVSVALVAGDGGAVTWPAHTSLLKAKQYLLTGDPVPAAEGRLYLKKNSAKEYGVGTVPTAPLSQAAQPAKSTP